jgi:hypothetical protein
MQNSFVTIGAMAFIAIGLSRGMSGFELMALGAFGGGLGGLAGGLLFGFDENSAPE